MTTTLEERVQHAIEIATEARAKAQSAELRMSGHEELCAERYKNINSSISDVQNIIKWAGTTLTGAILMVLGWLIVQQWTMQQQRISLLEQNQSSMVAPPE